MEFGKIVDNELVLRPKVVHLNGVAYSSPDAAICLACEEGPFYKVNRRSRTAATQCYHWTSKRMGWEIVENEIWGIYESEKDASPVYRYSKLKLIVASKSAGKWEAFKAFIASAGYEDEWQACQFLSSGYEQFEQAKTAVIAAGIATSDEIEAILAASVDEEVGT